MIKNDDSLKLFNNSVVDGFMKFKEICEPYIKDKEMMINFMKILSLHNLIGDSIMKEEM